MDSRFVAGLAVAALIVIGLEARVDAQLGALVSPGQLSQPHAKLEGLSNCQACHERGRGVTAEKCLACHRPVADRIARRSGVHKDVKGECVTCHAEHAGVDGELRPFDQKAFNHAAVTGFALDGKHAPVANRCEACHKVRSFITLATACAACHDDVHKGALDRTCTSCHSTAVAFKEARAEFDHSKAAFPLTGAHRSVTCASCHADQRFKGVKYAACTDCHRDPHRWAMAAAATRTPILAAQIQPTGTACTACHSTETWRSTKVNHDTQTAFPLRGRHATVACAACHTQPPMKAKPRSDACAACHVDVHRGAFKQDCAACHNESSFGKAPFDHSQTAFALTGEHQGLACSACHQAAAAVVPGAAGARSPVTTTVDFRGLKAACASCHVDVHRAELGTTCESCHSTTTFRIPDYVHPRFAEFFAGQHTPLTCNQCHVPDAVTEPVRSDRPVLRVRYRAASTTCASCHRDIHLGQEGVECERCHTLQAPRFAIRDFSHAQTTFALAGKHATLACASCHKTETGVFPAGSGTAVRWKGVARACVGCHADVHLGQLGTGCEACHGNDTFRLPGYIHRGRASASFFVGQHARASCEACHKPTTGQFPAGTGTAVRFQIDTRCVACHVDVHRGSLGQDCGSCHRP